MEGKEMRVKLDKYEKEIEKSADEYKPISKKEKLELESALSGLRKNKNVNIRISERVLEELKRLSIEEGIPYQTLISSVLHKYVTNRLVDEKAIRKSLQLLNPSNK